MLSQGYNVISWDFSKSEKIINSTSGSYVVEKDGYIFAQAQGIQGREAIYLNDVELLLGGADGTHWYTDSTFIPVKKNDVITTYGIIYGSVGTRAATASVWYMPK